MDLASDNSTGEWRLSTSARSGGGLRQYDQGIDSANLTLDSGCLTLRTRPWYYPRRLASKRRLSAPKPPPSAGGEAGHRTGGAMVIAERYRIRFAVSIPKQQHTHVYAARSAALLSPTNDRRSIWHGQQTLTLTELQRTKNPNLNVRSNGS